MGFSMLNPFPISLFQQVDTKNAYKGILEPVEREISVVLLMRSIDRIMSLSTSPNLVRLLLLKKA